MDDINMKTKKRLFGVGINDADYSVVKTETISFANGKQKRVWTCLYYRAWADMLKRCYSVKYQDSKPTYKGCSVSEEWLTFSNFKSWMQEQDWEGLQLDKDLLIEGNKVYSAETCVFVTGAVNNFAIDRESSRGESLTGLHWNKGANKFRAQCSNPFTKKREHLGYFTCEQQAHKAWQVRKLELAHELAAIQTDERVAKALVDRYSK